MDSRLPNRTNAVSQPGFRPSVTFSVVAPIYNEEETLPQFYRRVTAVMERLGEPFELLLVDDGSRDGSSGLLGAMAQDDPRVRVVRLSRNFGHQMALSAGLDYARGQAVITLDADLQDPPDVIPELVTRWREGGQVVYAQRTRRRGETAFKRLTAAAFYRLVSRLSTIPIPSDAGDFRLLDRRVVDVLVRSREQHRYLRGLSAWAGFRQVAVPYQRLERVAGETKYSLKKMVRLAVDAITGFSAAPLQLATYIGLALLGLSLLAAIATTLAGLLGAPLPWSAILLLLVLLLSATQLICIGILGQYLGRIYDEVRGRPLYIVSEVLEGRGGQHVARAGGVRTGCGAGDGTWPGMRAISARRNALAATTRPPPPDTSRGADGARWRGSRRTDRRERHATTVKWG